MPDPAAIERRRRPPVQDAVQIAPPGRRQARIEIGRDRLDGEDADRVRLQVIIDRAADLVGQRRRAADRHARPGPARARRHRCARRRTRSGSRRRTGAARFPAPPGSTARSAGAASRQSRCRNIRSSACSGARQYRPGRQREAAQEVVGIERRTAGTLQAQRPEYALAAGDRQALVEHRAGRRRRGGSARLRPRARGCRSPRPRNQAPGHGSKARTCRSNAAAGRRQSSRASSRRSFAA